MTTPAARRKWQVIADDLRSAIEQGQYGEDGRLPGENVLMVSYEVSRNTARQALAVLQQEGLAVARTGSGVYVRRFRPIVRASPDRLARAQWAAGRSVWEVDAGGRQVTVDRVDVHEDQADQLVARLLGIEPGARVWVRSRRYLLDGRPIQIAVSHLPADLADGTPITEPDPGAGGIYARLADAGAAPKDFVEEVRARPAEASETAALQLPANALVLHIVRTALAGDGRPVETNAMTLDASAYVLRYWFSASD